MTRRALTLLEVVVAIALVAMLGATVAAFGQSVLGRAAWLGSARDRLALDAVLFDRLDAALLGTFVGGGPEGAGVLGDTTSITLLTRSPFADADGTALRDLARVTARWDEQAMTLTLAHEDVLGTTPALREPFEGRLRRVRFRYHDGQGWRDEFDSTKAGTLPVLVEVAAWFQAGAPAAQPTDDATESQTPPTRVRVLAVPFARAEEQAP